MNTTLKTLIATTAIATAFAPSAMAMPVGDTGRTQEAQVAAKPQAHDGVPLPMAGGVIAVVMLSFGGVAAAAKRRKTVRAAFPIW